MGWIEILLERFLPRSGNCRNIFSRWRLDWTSVHRGREEMVSLSSWMVQRVGKLCVDDDAVSTRLTDGRGIVGTAWINRCSLDGWARRGAIKRGGKGEKRRRFLFYTRVGEILRALNDRIISDNSQKWRRWNFEFPILSLFFPFLFFFWQLTKINFNF